MGTNHQAPVSGTKRAVSEAKELVRAAAPVCELDQLRESEERFRNAFDHAALGMFLTDLDGTWLRVNTALCEIVGYSEQELLASKFQAVTHPDDLHADLAAMKRFLNGEISTYQSEKRFVRKDGRPVWVQLSVSLVRDSQGQPLYFVGHVYNIDRRKRTEQELARDALLLSSVTDSVIVTDSEGVITYWNEGAAQLYGWSAQEMLGRPCAQMFPSSEARNVVDFQLRRLFEKGSEWRGEWEVFRKDGSRIWIYCHVRRFCDVQGKPIGVLGISHDISEQKRAEQELCEQSRILRLVLDNMVEGVAVVNEHGDPLLVNPAATRIIGPAPADLPSQEVPEFFGLYQADGKSLYPFDRLPLFRARQGETVDSPEEIFIRNAQRPQGAWMSAAARPLVDEQGCVRGAVTVFRDITPAKAAEEAVARLAAIIASSDDAIISRALDGVITSWNPGAERLYGYTAEEALHKPITLIIPPENQEEHCTLMERLRSGERIAAFETQRLHKCGRRIDISVSFSPMRDGQGQVIGSSSIAHDITDKKRLEEQFLHAQKMDSIGRLAGGVAHDFNNLLTVINGYSNMFLDALPENDRLRSMVEEINKAGERAAGLTAQLLAFSRQQILQPKVLDVNALIVNIHNMLARLIGEDIELATSPAPDLARIKADQGQLEQVLVNLAVNARDAMPEGGRLTIETANVTFDGNWVLEQPEVPPGTYVLLAVSDTGIGMDRETQAHIFEPFFTTKENGKGTGLGLAMVYGFVKSSGGHVRVYSEVGMGTTFKLFFPALPPTEGARAKQSRPVKILGGAETLLLVEDEAGVRKLTHHLLERLGYRVLTAEDGVVALKMAAEHSGRIDLLITDVVMPGLSGPQVAERLRTQYPHIKVLYLSGYTDDAVFRHGVLEAETAFLQKPFTNADLATKVRKVLGKRE